MSPTPPTTAEDLLGLLDSLHLLAPEQLQTLRQQPNLPTEARTLARELVSRGWLTVYQVNQIFQGKGEGLLYGSYVLLEKLGEGGMGTVFRARNWKLGRIVAVKLVRHERLGSEQAVRRFQREIRAAARLDHPHIVRALDADEVNGTHLFVMEYVEGIDLARLVKDQGPLPIRQACTHILHAALGLQHVHECGLVHRDIKPHNLLLSSDGVVKILDLGLARFETVEGEESSTLTPEGIMTGTPDFLAPEQALDAHLADIRADLYSLGCTLYFLLTGRAPFPGGTLAQKISHHLCRAPQPVHQVRADVPPAVDAVVGQLLAKDPDDRYQTPQELARALEQVLVRLDRTSEDSQTVLEPFAHLEGKGSAIVRELRMAGWGVSWRQVGKSVLLAMVALTVVPLGVGLVWLLGKESNTAEHRGQPPQPVDRDEQVGRPIKINSIGMRLVLIPAGKFTMGSPAQEQGRGEDEGPRHEVTITHPFYLGVYEVTQEQYQKVMRDNPSWFSSTGGGSELVKGLDTRLFPVERVSWENAVEFCKILSQFPEERASHRVYRLPTEAEWEYACRVGASSYSPFHFGKTLTSHQANFNGDPPFGVQISGPYLQRPTWVGSYPENDFGLYDMHGNVWEWCSDWYHKDYYAHSPRCNPQGPAENLGRRVFRGGSWPNLAISCRAATRKKAIPRNRSNNLGFRVALVRSGE